MLLPLLLCPNIVDLPWEQPNQAEAIALVGKEEVMSKAGIETARGRMALPYTSNSMHPTARSQPGGTAAPAPQHQRKSLA
jgi:hypothetical protein